ncbi:hypothetical protein C0993_002827 [Termitomyces sp. T159_Od127]|nr:hypothetical protein C0993_002827 [Termitomyces sp. T159_Od127]
MTSLPSFVELMASLGLDQTTKIPDLQPHSALSSPSTSPQLIGAGMPMRSRSKSSQSLRDSSRTRVARYSPYSSTIPSSRRDSISSVSSLEHEQSPTRAISPSKPTSPRRVSRRPANNLSINIYGSASDLAVNTPISSYVRRKTPGASPTSPTFPHEFRDSPTISPMPMTVPTLPAFWHKSSPSSLPTTRDTESPTTENCSSGEVAKTHRRSRRSIGTRISTPP